MIDRNMIIYKNKTRITIQCCIYTQCSLTICFHIQGPNKPEDNEATSTTNQTINQTIECNMSIPDTKVCMYMQLAKLFSSQLLHTSQGVSIKQKENYRPRPGDTGSE